MPDHSANKQLFVRFLTELADASDERAIHGVLRQYCTTDCVFQIFHPYNRIDGIAAAARDFWAPLKASFPDHEHRIAFAIAGEYEGREQVSTWGHIFGNFEEAWLGIPPTWMTVTQRVGVNAIVENGRFTKLYVLLDIIDVMLQAGYYPLRQMPGSPGQWAFPPCDAGATALEVDSEAGANSLRIVREMQLALPPPNSKLTAEESRARHSPHWHENMNWFGPAGIGSSRGRRGFRDYHGALFLQAFPNREGIKRDGGGIPEDSPGHYTRLGDGKYVVTGGNPSIYATHTGSQWLGLPPTGAKVEMRVADWYRLDENDKIIDNWVMIDIPHILHQMGLDVFDDLQFFVNRSKSRLRT